MRSLDVGCKSLKQSDVCNEVEQSRHNLDAVINVVTLSHSELSPQDVATLLNLVRDKLVSFESSLKNAKELSG